MPRRSPTLTIPVLALAGLVLLGCPPNGEPPDRTPATEPDDATDPGEDLRLVVPAVVDSVTITIEGCAPDSQPTDTIRIVVEPWEAHVRPGRAFHWSVRGTNVRDVRVRGRGPGPGIPTNLPPAGPNDRIEVPGGFQGSPGTRIPYDITAQCDNRPLLIDPDIVIRDPGGLHRGPQPN